MSFESYLTDEQKKWLNSKVHFIYKKNIKDFVFLDDYVYAIIKDFSTILNKGKIYTTGIGGMGHVLIVKRDDRSEPFEYNFFFTNSRILPPTHEYIAEYTDVSNIIEQIRDKRIENMTYENKYFPEFNTDIEDENKT